MLGYHNACLQGVQSALASVGSRAYADYMVDAMANTWTGALGIDGYTEDCSCNYPCMLQTIKEGGGQKAFAEIMKRVREQQPQVVHVVDNGPVVFGGGFYGPPPMMYGADVGLGVGAGLAGGLMLGAAMDGGFHDEGFGGEGFGGGFDGGWD